MKQQIFSRLNKLTVLFECEIPEGVESGLAMRHALEKAVSLDANLSDAELSDADLRHAYLRVAVTYLGVPAISMAFLVWIATL